MIKVVLLCLAVLVAGICLGLLFGGSVPRSLTTVTKGFCESCYSPCQMRWKAYSEKETKPNPNPPLKPPSELLDQYETFGATRIMYSYAKEVYMGAKAKVSSWKRGYVNEMILKAKAQRENKKGVNSYGNYGYEMAGINAAFEENSVKGKKALVVGSENPWIEALLLSHGVVHVTTLEYGKIECDHPQVCSVCLEDLFLQVFLLLFFFWKDSHITTKGIGQRNLRRGCNF